MVAKLGKSSVIVEQKLAQAVNDATGAPAPEGFSALGDVLKRFNPTKDRFISREFQKYAYDLAEELMDLPHKSLYMRLVKTTPRHLIEQARYFVKDAQRVDNRGRLFMWKLSQLKKEKKERDEKKAKIDTEA